MSGMSGAWNDTDCKVNQRYICERSLCETGWLGYQDNCYYFSKIGERKSWYAARAYCREKNAHLAIIRDINERTWVESQLGHTGYWIGLTDMSGEGKWTWLDGTPLKKDLANWRRGEPNNRKGNEDCGEIAPGGWNDHSCRRRRGYICKRY
ncbi:CD209 antigen-like protein E [Corythoichthys intestinalis]|uniref:CD209 antigen-like protein E n=1 Tax=Corythoichthys intestinalis TaxID=161448 RepID=UPI0025A56BAC|nr:CD209 antigen-like protein E [Corythoichthys intestinalis]